jgi:uncharacterized damage-inducible protein DinB
VVNVVDNFRLLARYNQWMHEKIYEACALLSEEDLHKDRKAFLGSIIGTFSHQTHNRGQITALFVWMWG